MVYRRTPRIEEKLRQRDLQILKAAKSCIAELGFAGTRVRDIVQKAGCSNGAFYEALGSKEAAIEAIGTQAVTALTDALEVLWTTTDARGAFDQGIHLVFEVFSKDKEMTTVLFSDYGGTKGRKIHDSVITSMVDFTSGQIDRGIEFGFFSEQDSKLAARCVVGAITLHLTRWATLQKVSKKAMLSEAPDIANLLWSLLRSKGDVDASEADRG